MIKDTVLKYPSILNIFKVENFLRLTMYLAKGNLQIKDSSPPKSVYNHCIVLSGNPCWRPKDLKGTEGKTLTCEHNPYCWKKLGKGLAGQLLWLLLSNCSVLSKSLWPYGQELARLLCPGHFPRKNTGVGCLFLLRGFSQGLKPSSAWQADSFTTEPPGSWYMREITVARAEKSTENQIVNKVNSGDFPSGPEAKTLHSQCREPRFYP